MKDNDRIMVEHHIKYKEIHGVDETVWMTQSEHQKLHRKLREEGKYNIPAEDLKPIVKAAHQRTRKYKEYKKNYMEENREKISEQRKGYRENNKEIIKRQKKEYYEKNKEKIKERVKRNYERKKRENQEEAKTI